MKIHLEALPGEAVPEETFVSVRIGDLRKLSHFTSSRSYNFPADSLKASESKYGFIEVYKRVGTTVIDFDDLDGAEAHDVDVACNQPGFDKLGLKITVDEMDAFQATKKRSRRSEQGSRYRARMEAVKEYMAHHNIEQLVSDSVGRLLKDKPDDPRLMLSNYVHKYALLPPLEEEAENSRRHQLAKKTNAELGITKSLRFAGDDLIVNKLPARDLVDPHSDYMKPLPVFGQPQPIEASVKPCLVTSPPTPEILFAETHVQEAAPTDVEARSSWKWLPSIGSWLSPRLPANKFFDSKDINDLPKNCETNVEDSGLAQMIVRAGEHLAEFEVEQLGKQEQAHDVLRGDYEQEECRQRKNISESEVVDSSVPSSAQVALENPHGRLLEDEREVPASVEQSLLDPHKKEESDDIDDWNSEIPKEDEIEEPDQEPEVAFEEPEVVFESQTCSNEPLDFQVSPFVHRPSVGSWLSSRPNDRITFSGSSHSFELDQEARKENDGHQLVLQVAKAQEAEQAQGDDEGLQQARQAELATMQAKELALKEEAERLALQQARQAELATMQAKELALKEEAETLALQQARQAELATMQATELSLKAEDAKLAADLEWAHQAAAKLEKSRLESAAFMKAEIEKQLEESHSLQRDESSFQADGRSSEVAHFTPLAEKAVEENRLGKGILPKSSASPKGHSQKILDAADRLETQAASSIDPKAAEARLLRLFEQCRDTTWSKLEAKADCILPQASEVKCCVPTQEEDEKIEQTIIPQDSEKILDQKPLPIESIDSESIDTDMCLQSNMTVGRSIANAMVTRSFDQAAIDVRPPSVTSLSNLEAQSEASYEIAARVSHSPRASSLASAFVFGATGALRDLEPEAYACSVTSGSVRGNDIIIAIPRPSSQASGVSGTTVGDLPSLSARERRQNETEERIASLPANDFDRVEEDTSRPELRERSSVQPDSLQLLRMQTIRELVQERDEALAMLSIASEDEQEALEVKVEMLELALQAARAEYVAAYETQ